MRTAGDFDIEVRGYCYTRFGEVIFSYKEASTTLLPHTNQQLHSFLLSPLCIIDLKKSVPGYFPVCENCAGTNYIAQERHNPPFSHNPHPQDGMSLFSVHLCASFSLSFVICFVVMIHYAFFSLFGVYLYKYNVIFV